MQTMAPPDEVLKERFDRIDERIADAGRRAAETAKGTDRRLKEINRRISESNEATNRRFKEVDRRFEEVNRRLDANTAEVKGLWQEMNGLQTTFQRGNYTLIATIVAAVLTFLIKGG